MPELPTGTVTFLFTDIEGSTRLWEEHPDEMKYALARHDEILRDAVVSQGGHVVKTTGDGVHAVFARAGDALAAAIAGQQGIEAEPWAGTPRLRVRMGVHTGEAESREGDYYGPSLNRAARLMAAGHGGQVLVSHATEELVRDALPPDTALVDLGEHRLRDLARPDRVFQVRAAELPDEFAPLKTLDSFAGNLPIQLTSFVGRENEMKDIADALRTSRLVTLTGVGGVGKTRLATQIAAELLPEFSDGAWLCELAGADSSESMLELVAATLAIQRRPEMTLEASVVEFLRTKGLLLVLDNCEHVLDAASRLSQAVLSRAPNVRVLATSREGFGIGGEQVWPLRSLSLPDAGDPLAATSDAVLLFEDRARAARPQFELEERNVAEVTEICRRLDGIPLAIELAAARVVSMSPSEIAARIDERFRLLTGGRRSAVERHQTLRATVDWSYSLLDERDRTVFDRLAVFAGGFEMASAEAVVAGDGIETWDVLDAIGDLASKSMIVSEETKDGVVRHQLLETMRHYALERLDEDGDADTWRRRHAEHFAEFAEIAGRAMRSADEFRWRRRFVAELDNLRNAVSWALESPQDDDGELALRIITGVTPQTAFDPPLGTGAWALRAVDRAERSTAARRQCVLSAAAYQLANLGDLDAATALVEEALREGVPDDSPWPAFPAITLSYIHATAGRMVEAVEVLETALRELPRFADEGELMSIHGTISGTLNWFGDIDEAIQHARTALEISRPTNNPSSIASSLYCLGVVLSTEDPQASRAHFEECLPLIDAGATPVLRGFAYASAAGARAVTGDRRGALEALRVAVTYGLDTGNFGVHQVTIMDGMLALIDIGQHELAATLLGHGPKVAIEITEELQAGSATQWWDQYLERLENALAPEVRAAAMARGESMSTEELLLFTRSEIDRLLSEMDG